MSDFVLAVAVVAVLVVSPSPALTIMVEVLSVEAPLVVLAIDVDAVTKEADVVARGRGGRGRHLGGGRCRPGGRKVSAWVANAESLRHGWNRIAIETIGIRAANGVLLQDARKSQRQLAEARQVRNRTEERAVGQQNSVNR